MKRKQPETFSVTVRKRLLERGQSILGFSEELGYPRNSVSLVIHQRRRMPKVEAAIRKELGL